MNTMNWMYQTYTSPEDLDYAIRAAFAVIHGTNHLFQLSEVVPGTCMMCGAPKLFARKYCCGHTAYDHMKLMIEALESEPNKAFLTFKKDLKGVVNGTLQTSFFK